MYPSATPATMSVGLVPSILMVAAFDGSLVPRLERVDAPGRPVRRVRGVDLDLIALVDRHPRVVTRLRVADEDAGVVVPGHLPVHLQAVGVELLLEGEQAHAARGQDRAVLLLDELPGTGHLPGLEARRP